MVNISSMALIMTSKIGFFFGLVSFITSVVFSSFKVSTRFAFVHSCMIPIVMAAINTIPLVRSLRGGIFIPSLFIVVDGEKM